MKAHGGPADGATPVAVLHASDPHFGTEQPVVLEALVDLAAAIRPRLVVWSGDLTQRARPDQFDRARAAVDRVTRAAGASAALVIPGNHDVPLFDVVRRAFDPYGSYRRVFGPDLAPAYADEALLAVGVNTTRRWRHKDGEVSREQVDAVAEWLRAGRGSQLKLVVVHQPVVAVAGSDVHNLLHGRERAIAAWRTAGADLVLGGHIHLPYVAALGGGLWSVQAGTAVSRRVRPPAPNSVHVIRWSGRGDTIGPGRHAGVERWDFGQHGAGFRPVERTDLALRPGIVGARAPA